MVTLDRLDPQMTRRAAGDDVPIIPKAAVPRLPALQVPMGPVDASRVGANLVRAGAPHTLASFFHRSPAVRAVLLGTTILVSGLLAAPAVAQVGGITKVDFIEQPVPTGLKSALLDDVSLAMVARGQQLLSLDDEGEAVQRVQRALLMVGIPIRGGADGDFGSATADAVQAFTRRAGLMPRVHVDRSVLIALDAETRVAETITTPRFRTTPAFLQIALGHATLERGTTDEASTEILQASLYALGEDLGGSFIDADFGDATEAALRSFQAKAELPETGVLDRETLEAIDSAASDQLAALRVAVVPPGTKHERYSIVGDLVTNRIYVVDKATDEPIARYLTSPGKPGHRTRGDAFTVQRTMVRKTWYPTPSMNARPIGPGLKNPMGLVKFNLGRYYQYIHGTPFSVRDRLGEPASRGCFRMSTENILDIADYIEPGTHVAVNRDAAESERLAAAAQRLGVDDEPLDVGREKLAAYLTGEMGEDEELRR